MHHCLNHPTLFKSVEIHAKLISNNLLFHKLFATYLPWQRRILPIHIRLSKQEFCKEPGQALCRPKSKTFWTEFTQLSLQMPILIASSNQHSQMNRLVCLTAPKYWLTICLMTRSRLSIHSSSRALTEQTTLIYGQWMAQFRKDGTQNTLTV